MAIKMSQSMKQTQSLTITPQLQQAIKLLTLTHLEMTNLIEKEMVENPMLEETVPTESDKIDKLEMENKEAKADNFQEESVVNNKDDFDWNKYVDSYNNNSSTPSNMATRDPDDEFNYENMVTRGESLAEHLEMQLTMENLDEQEISFGLSIIRNLNDDGYMEGQFDDLLAKTKLSREQAFGILGMIQRFDPVGCACHDLKECLLAQARIKEERSPLLEKIIRFHLDELKSRNLKKVAEKIGVGLEALENCLLLLQKFHPKPGRLVGGEETHFIVPDIYIVQVGDEFVVKVNDDGVPRLRISQTYQKMLKDYDNGFGSKEANDFVQDKLKSAMWLIKSVQNRQKTIYRVAHSIVRQQQEFFKKGSKYLKPMILKDIASEIGVHESTVSRVTNNKYMHTPIGMFELKYFFSTSIGGDKGGIDISGEGLKFKIKELIQAESPKKPLSDQKIADLLSKSDVKVARRTIAKYRELLEIPSSSQRKVK